METKKHAIFSKDRKYRYLLRRTWDSDKPSCNFICINPSIANEHEDDLTVIGCISWATKLGFGSFEITNLFAFVDTNKKNFYSEKDPVGPRNDKYLFQAANNCDTIIVAWGNEGSYQSRDSHVIDILRKIKKKIYCLKINSTGAPHHPSRLSYTNKLIIYSK